MHLMRWALTFARDNAGNSSAARMAMMAMTTNNSINVNPRREFPPKTAFRGWLNGDGSALNVAGFMSAHFPGVFFNLT
jgi:hypothetical protein